MNKITALVLSIGVFVASTHALPSTHVVHVDPVKSEKALIKTFSDTYYENVDKTNKALQVYGNTPCTEPEFAAAEKTFKADYEYLRGMYKSIPDAQNELEQAREIETFIGLTQLAQDTVDTQTECQQNGPGSGNSFPVPNNSQK
jgi:hypothetical protein